MSPSVAVRAGIPFVGPGSFDPVNLSGLIWLLHFDDATDIIGGEINSIVCRKSGLTFSAPAAANRMPLDTTERPGHQVARCATLNADFMQCTDSTLAMAIGSGAFSMFSWHRFSALSINAYFFMYHGASTYNNGNRFQWNFTTSGGTSRSTLVLQQASPTILDISDTFATTWTYSQMDCDGSGSASYYRNNVLIGSASGTDRDPVTFLNVKYGGGTGYFSLGGVVAGRNLTSGERSSLYTWMQANA